MPTLAAGLVIALVDASAEISLALLIFSGNLAVFVPQGIGLVIAGSIVAILITGITSSYAGMISPNQDIPAAIFAGIAAGISAALVAQATQTQIFITVSAAIIITSLLTGLIFLLLGRFKLGALFRFLPYPVVGGFLAGTGWLLATGGLAAMAGTSSEFSQLPDLFQPEI